MNDPRPKDYAPCAWCGAQPVERAGRAPSGHDGKRRAVSVSVSCDSKRCVVRPGSNGTVSITVDIEGKETIGENLRIKPDAFDQAVLKARKYLVKVWNKRDFARNAAWWMKQATK